MTRKNVVVLGGTGMLGAMVATVLARQDGLAVTATRRSTESVLLGHLAVTWRELDAFSASVQDCRQACEGASWIINCIGITKPLIADDDAVKVDRAIRVNAVFAHTLATAAQELRARVLQIATDCVYSGRTGSYREADAHDALDVYGKSKSLGEVSAAGFHHIRASIIGPEPKEYKFLLEWFTGQPHGAALNGFTNHLWNGVTTLHFAKILLGIIQADVSLPKVHHLLPADRITKAAMLNCFARSYGRGDIVVKEIEAGSSIDRTLSTCQESLNQQLWALAGYDTAPTVEQMIEELSHYDVGFRRTPDAV